MKAEIWVVEFLRKDGKPLQIPHYGGSYTSGEAAQTQVDAIQTRAAARAVHFVEADDTPCVWKRDSHGFWNGECGGEFWLPDGLLDEMEITYCPKCGRKIEEKP